MRIVCTHSFVKSDLLYLKKNIPNGDIIVPSNYTDKGIMDACHKGVDVFLGPPPTEEILKKVVSKLKFIQIPWNGVDRIDFSTCKKLNIKCFNSHSNSDSVAELGLGLLFSLLKKIPFHDSELKKGKWHRPGDPEEFFPPTLLKGKTIGYFGFGAINQNIYQMLTGIKLKHVACVTSSREKENIKFFNFSEIEDFVSSSDIIFIAAPLTNKTRDVFDDHILSKIKVRGYIINLSRAEIIKEQSLIDALKSSLAGAAIDVWYHYPKRGDSRSLPCSKTLLECKNLIASPHRGGYSEEGIPHLLDVVENLNNFMHNLEIKNLINLERGY